MKKIISTVIAALLVFSSGGVFTFSEINSFFEYTPPTDGGDGGDDNNPVTPEEPTVPTLTVPEYRDYGRGTVDFSKIVYARPDIDGAISDFSALSDTVGENAIAFEEQLARICELDDVFFDISSMFTYANIMTKKDATDGFFSLEFSYISVNYPRLAQAVEGLFVACARSPHAESFEAEYFGEGLIEDYADGGSYSDELVELMAAEAELEADYSELDTATVRITYEGKTDSADSLIAYYYEKFGKSPITETTYLYHASRIKNLYYTAFAQAASPIFLNLLRTRSLIADELAMDSYAEYAYGGLGHDYDEQSMTSLLSDIAEFVMPLYYKLYVEVFNTYEPPEGLTVPHENEMLNTLYTVFKDTDPELYEAFCYMLQHGLHDVAPGGGGRYDGAFTTYLDKYNAPYIFVTTTGSVTDYFTVIHEFGHFFDAFVNDGEEASLDLSEISSQALELLLIGSLGEKLGEDISDYLLIKEIEEFLGTVRSQSFYSMIEHEIYALAYEDITEENINAIINSCEEKFYYPQNTFTLGTLVTVPHIVLYPYYVQSYVTSALVSLEIFFEECNSKGTGLAAYKELLSRGDESGFEGDLEATGLATPFEDGFVKEVVNKINRIIYGCDFFKNGALENAA